MLEAITMEECFERFKKILPILEDWNVRAYWGVSFRTS